MTKFFGLGRLRVGWILADKQRAHQMMEAKRLISGHDSEYSLWVARQVLKRRQQFVNRAQKICAENSKLVRKFIEGTKGISGELGVAPFCLLKYEKGPDSVSFAKNLLERTGVLVSPGDFFGSPKSIRLCFTLDKAKLVPGLRKISDYLNGV